MSKSERLVVRGDTWTLLSRTSYVRCEALFLNGATRSNVGTVRTILVPFDRPRRLTAIMSPKPVRRRRFLHALRSLATRVTPYGGLVRAHLSGIDLLPFQLEPALAVQRHGLTRLLVADEVGLGKTVQAGLILNEAAGASASFRALVVCPAGLRQQWAEELARHFGLSCTVSDASWLATAARELPPDINPWVLPGLYITSFDFIKRPDVLRSLEQPAWDILVVDEAHLASPSSHRLAAVDALARSSRRVVLLSATPHGGDDRQFAALCAIGAGAEPITIFRRARHEVATGTARRTVLFQVRPSPNERRMHRLLSSYTSRVAREAAARGDAAAHLAAVVLRKRALSSAGSLAASARRRLSLLASGAPPPADTQLLLPLEDDLADDNEPDAVLAAPGLADATAERETLIAITAAADLAARQETKAAFLLRFLSRAKEPVLVFTEFRDTLTRLDAMLRRSGFVPALLHGGLPAAERSRVQRAFNADARILLATDAASEGLNLHQRCRVVVHFELPWSPVRIEQRTGRVDRYGQRKRVHELLLVADDTAERLVLAPLARRAARASTHGPGQLTEALTESRVARAILLDDAMTSTTKSAETNVGGDFTRAPPEGLGAEAKAEAARLEELRQWHGASVSSHAGRRPNRPSISLVQVRASTLVTGLVCVYSLELHAGGHELVDSCLMCLHLPVKVHTRRWGRGAVIESREHMESCSPLIRARLESILGERRTEVQTRHLRVLEAAVMRERLIASRVPSEARRLVQASLFDRRALRNHEEQKEDGRALIEECMARIAVLERLRELTPEITLRAVLLVR